MKKKNKTSKPSRREFLNQAVTGAGLALAGSALPAWAQQGLKSKTPTPQSITYLDRRTYVHNMEVLAHILPGEVRTDKLQMMSIGDRRYLLQKGDVIDV